jgi:hypothetical protein
MAARQLSITVPKDLADRAQTMVAAGEAGSLSGYLSDALAHRLDADERRLRSHALVDSVFGLAPDPVADASVDRVVAVIHAQASALAWVHETTGAYPAPRAVCEAVAAVAARLRASDDQDPATALHQVAAAALSAHRAGA